MGPEHVSVIVVVSGDRLPEPDRLLTAVQAEERHGLAGHLNHQLMQQGRWQPVSRVGAAVVRDDPQQGHQIPLAHRDRDRHRDPPLASMASTLAPAGSAGTYAERLMAAGREVVHTLGRRGTARAVHQEYSG
jgi:hypothetical protein